VTKRPQKLFVGVGNVLRRDEGVGSHAAQIMATRPLPSDVEVYDAGTVGLDAAVVLEKRQRVVVADAIDAGAEPGAIFRLDPNQLLPAARSSLSLHDLHLLNALEETRLLGTAPDEVVVFAVQVGDVSLGLDLTPLVESSLERVLRLASQALGLPSTSGWSTESRSLWHSPDSPDP
jgi:hydrogenase maturation protease